MKTYEISYIISSKITSEEADKTSKEVESFIQSKEGVIFKSEKPVIKTLAYPIKKQFSGYFTLLDFQIEENKIKEIRELIGKNSNVIRYFLAAKNPIKELKRKRTRMPLSKMEIYGTKSAAATGEPIKETVKAEDIDKKLEEILSE